MDPQGLIFGGLPPSLRFQCFQDQSARAARIGETEIVGAIPGQLFLRAKLGQSLFIIFFIQSKRFLFQIVALDRPVVRRFPIGAVPLLMLLDPENKYAAFNVSPSFSQAANSGSLSSPPGIWDS